MNLGRTLAVLTGLTIISAATAASTPAVLAATGLLSLGAYLWSTSSGPIAVKDVPEFDCSKECSFHFDTHRPLYEIIQAYKNHQKLTDEEARAIRFLDQRIIDYPQEPIHDYQTKTNKVIIDKPYDKDRKLKTYFHTYEGVSSDSNKPCLLLCRDGEVIGDTVGEFGSIEEDEELPFYIDGAYLTIDGKRVFPHTKGVYVATGETTRCDAPKKYLKKGEHAYAIDHETMIKLCKSIHLGYVPDELKSEEEKKGDYVSFHVSHRFENPKDQEAFKEELLKQQRKTV